MEIIEKKCTNCGKNVFVQKDIVREKMFCTLLCMGQYQKSNGHKH